MNCPVSEKGGFAHGVAVWGGDKNRLVCSRRSLNQTKSFSRWSAAGKGTAARATTRRGGYASAGFAGLGPSGRGPPAGRCRSSLRQHKILSGVAGLNRKPRKTPGVIRDLLRLCKLIQDVAGDWALADFSWPPSMAQVCFFVRYLCRKSPFYGLPVAPVKHLFTHLRHPMSTKNALPGQEATPGLAGLRV